jgi:hypothetical protein
MREIETQVCDECGGEGVISPIDYMCSKCGGNGHLLIVAGYDEPVALSILEYNYYLAHKKSEDARAARDDADKALSLLRGKVLNTSYMPGIGSSFSEAWRNIERSPEADAAALAERVFVGARIREAMHRYKLLKAIEALGEVLEWGK